MLESFPLTVDADSCPSGFSICEFLAALTVRQKFSSSAAMIQFGVDDPAVSHLQQSEENDPLTC